MAEILRTKISNSSTQGQAFSAWPMLARTQMAASSSCVQQPAPGWMESMVSGMLMCQNAGTLGADLPMRGSLPALHYKQEVCQIYR